MRVFSFCTFGLGRRSSPAYSHHCNHHSDFILFVRTDVSLAVDDIIMLVYTYLSRFVSRIIAGVGVGLSTVAVPILQAETLPAYNRGALLVVQSLLIVAGIAISSWICLGTLFADSDLQWRFPVS